jgi:hypothetical protein
MLHPEIDRFCPIKSSIRASVPTRVYHGNSTWRNDQINSATSATQ